MYDFCQFHYFLVLFQSQKMKYQVKKTVHYRHLLLLEYNRGVNAAKAAREVCNVYGDDTMPQSIAQLCFSRFKKEHFELLDGVKQVSLRKFLSDDHSTGETYQLRSQNCDKSPNI